MTLRYQKAIQLNEVREFVENDNVDQQVEESKKLDEYYELPAFENNVLGKHIARKQPKTLMTDGALHFHGAFMDAYWSSNVGIRPEHIRDIRLDG